MAIRWYRQSVNMKNSAWAKPYVSTDPTHEFVNKLWREVKKPGMEVLSGRLPYAINKIERWHKNKGHKVLRNKRVYGGRRHVFLTITERS